MRVISSFPDTLPLINEQVAEVVLHHALSRDDEYPESLPEIEQLEAEGVANFEYGGAEFSIILKDGRCFQFSAYTPERLRILMDREQSLSYVDIGLTIISEPTVNAILAAVEECLEKGRSYQSLEHFGFPC